MLCTSVLDDVMFADDSQEATQWRLNREEHGFDTVSVFVSRRSYLRNYIADLHQIFCACYVWLLLGPPLVA